jgi:membrane protein involved in colicin uptake
MTKQKQVTEQKHEAPFSEKKEYSAKDKAYEEAAKLYYDANKHLTTLSTGSGIA